MMGKKVRLNEVKYDTYYYISAPWLIIVFHPMNISTLSYTLIFVENKSSGETFVLQQDDYNPSIHMTYLKFPYNVLLNHMIPTMHQRCQRLFITVPVPSVASCHILVLS